MPDTDIVIEKGTRIMIPTLGLHRDGDHYPDAEKFDPERFSDENRKSIVPFTYIPFGEGPRICIGKKLSLTVSLKLYLVFLFYFVCDSYTYYNNIFMFQECVLELCKRKLD